MYLGHQHGSFQLTEGPCWEQAIGCWLKPMSLGGHHQLMNLGHQGAGRKLTEGPAEEHAIGGWLTWVATINK